MKKYKYILLTIILLLFILNIDIVLSSTKDASIIFINKVFISVFPFIILSDILIYYDYELFIKKIFGSILSKLFNIDPNSSIIFILSLLTCSPNNAVYIKNMLDNKQIDELSSTKLLSFTYFPSISFVIGTIGVYLYKSFKIGLILYLFCILNNILIGLYLRKENTKTINNIKNKESSIFKVLKKSIIKSINTNFIILGNLIIFTIIINIFKKYLIVNPIIISILSGLFELTNGIINTSNLNINIIIKLLITLFILNFSGLSIIFQTRSILSDYNINIKKILIIKLVFSLITCLIFYILIIFLMH